MNVVLHLLELRGKINLFKLNLFCNCSLSHSEYRKRKPSEVIELEPVKMVKDKDDSDEENDKQDNQSDEGEKDKDNSKEDESGDSINFSYLDTLKIQ